MSSLEDIAAVKFAIVICNDPELKRKILHAFDGVKMSEDKYNDKRKWNEIVERQALVTLRSPGLPKILQQKVMNLVPAIGMGMLTWAAYHEKIIKFSREYSIDFLNSSFFTQQGLIDCKRAAEELMKDESLSIEQRYTLACVYCFRDHIAALFNQIPKEDRTKFCSIGSQHYHHPKLVRFWSDFLMDKMGKIIRGKTLDEYRLEIAINSGSKAAVEYCFENTSLRMKRGYLVDAAVQAVRNRTWASDDSGYVFRCWSDYRDHILCASWVPNDYYIDIVTFLLSKMTEDQKIEFLKKDIEGARYKRRRFEEHDRSTVLEYFLNWPYQDHFMKAAELMWEFLPESNYAKLLLKICDKMDPEFENNLKIGEENSYDYRGLLNEFWYQSPEHYKRYVLCNQGIEFLKDNVCVELLIKLLSMRRFTFEDGQIIGIILASAKDKDKENILSSRWWRHYCIELMKEDKLKLLDRFVLRYFSSKQLNEFKRELIFTEDPLFDHDFQYVLFHLVENDKWEAAESALKWSSLSEAEVNQFKTKMIHSLCGKHACLRLILRKEDVEVTNQFIKWCIASEEEIRDYKEELIFSIIGLEFCESLVLNGKLELIDKVTDCWLSPQEKIKEFKEKFLFLMGHDICEKLISGYSEGKSYNGFRRKLRRGKWEEVEKFLTWCFSSEEEIVDFKRHLLRDSGKAILLNLIISSQWEDAEIYFAWLGLSIKEIQKLKEDTVLDREFIFILHRMISSEDDAFFVHYRSKQEAIELILRWCTTDEETVLEIKDKVKKMSRNIYPYKQDTDALKNFDLIVEQHLKDIHEEQMEAKRKSETVFSPNKKL